MLKHPEVTERRIARALGRVRRLIYPERLPLNVEAFEVPGEPMEPAEAVCQSFTPFATGGLWGELWGTVWFHFSGTIPPAWKGREVVALVRLADSGRPEGFTAEGLVWQNGVPTRALNVNRADVPITPKARGGETFSFHVEAAANSVGDDYAIPAPTNVDPEGRRLFKLACAELACFDREAWDFYQDMRLACEAMRALPENEPRRGQLRYALNATVNILEASDEAPLRRARRPLTDVLTRGNGDSVHRVSAIGHAHIDTAWLWPLRETIRKCARTFSTALAYMEAYPDYVFGCSQAQQYAWMKMYYPTIFDGIRKAVRRGQWEPIGSMWVEPDCNIPSGESLIRQIIRGKAFFLEEFGIETREAWIPDVFGYAASLPQIFRKAGIDLFVTAKMSWSQFNRFPHHTFLWEGIDGSRIFTHFPPAETYNGSMQPGELLESVRNFQDHDRATRSLYAYGFGDGGGGPTRDMLEAAKRLRDFEGLPRVHQEKVSDFFRKALKDARDLPVWVGELYLELHRGTYTTQARTKRNNRKCEALLHDAEWLEAVATTLSVPDSFGPATEPPPARHDTGGRTPLERAWNLLLLNQFHDIIPGSSIGRVYEDSERDYETIRSLVEPGLRGAGEAIAGLVDTAGCSRPFVVFNTSGHAREEVISLPGDEPCFVSVPPCGYSVIDAGRRRPVGSHAQPVFVREHSGAIEIDNGLLDIVIDAGGCLASAYDLRTARQVLAPGAVGNVFQLHPDFPNKHDAWDVDVFYRENVRDLREADRLTIAEQHPLRVAVRVERRFGRSTLSQRIILRAGSPRIDFETEVDWREEHRFLKVAFPVNVRSMRATYEIPFGHVERPTHENTSWDLARFETCAHRWADLSEGDYGVALLNDCKYGYDIRGNVLRLSLLRAPREPDPAADVGRHVFTYALLPHRAGCRHGGVIAEACALNQPLRSVPVEEGAGSLARQGSFFEVDRPGVVIDTVKRAEKDHGIIVRLYEAYGTRGRVCLRTAFLARRVHLTDLLERPQEELAMEGKAVTFDIGPFEIVTLRFLK